MRAREPKEERGESHVPGAHIFRKAISFPARKIEATTSLFLAVAASTGRIVFSAYGFVCNRLCHRTSDHRRDSDTKPARPPSPPLPSLPLPSASAAASVYGISMLDK